MLCVGNSSVVNIYIIRPNRDQLRKMQLQGNPEDAGSIPSRKALELHFSQLVRVGSYNVYVYDTRISYT